MQTIKMLDDAGFRVFMLVADEGESFHLGVNTSFVKGANEKPILIDVYKSGEHLQLLDADDVKFFTGSFVTQQYLIHRSVRVQVETCILVYNKI